jgi:catechol 2,3-dioxygenase-like lactoylglutathione lyase family enzyme
MLLSIDRILLRVSNLPAAAAHYQQRLGLKVLRRDKRLVVFRLEGGVEIVLHDDPDLPSEATYFLVDDVRDMHRRRAELKLTFAGPPQRVSRGYRASVKDGYGAVLHLIDRRGGDEQVEDAVAASGTLFPGTPARTPVRRARLIPIYQRINRTADDLPYTPHFEALYEQYTQDLPEPRPDRAEVWRHLLTVRKAGALPRVGEARSKPPEVSEEDRERLRQLLGEQPGKRDRLPYSARFDEIVERFNATQRRPMAPHHIWRLVATLTK